MLTPTELKEKHLLVIKSERNKENKIKFWNENIRFLKDEQVVNQVSCYNIFAIFIVGDISLTSNVIQKCQSYGISIFLLDYKLQEYAAINSELNGNYLLRSKQYAFADNLEFAKNLVVNKIENMRKLASIVDNEELLQIKRKICNAENLQELLGFEGNYSKRYFSQFFSEFEWKKRQPRARQDILNFLLDIGYYYLFNITDSLLKIYGFDTYKGIYHQLFFERKSLSCDVMEPFRCIIDKSIKKAYHLRQINNKDFKFINGQYNLSYDKSSRYSVIFLDAIMDNLDDIHKYVKSLYVYTLNNKKPLPYFNLKVR